LHGVSWGGGIEIYRNIRVAGIVLFFVMGIFLMARYYSSGGAYFVFHGIGFLGATALSALHLFLISSLYDEGLYVYSEAWIEWGYDSSIWFLLIFMLIPLFFSDEEKKEEEGRNVESYRKGILMGFFAFLLLSVVYYFVYPLPDIYYIDVIFGGVKEVGLILFLVATLLLYYFNNKTKEQIIFRWIACFLVSFLLSQILFISLSENKYDSLFNFGHIFANLAYLCFFIGVIVELRNYCKKTEEIRLELRARNEEIEMMKVKSSEIEKGYKDKEEEIEKTLLEIEKSRNELEKMNEMMVGREIKMIELKKEIANLKGSKS
jgi:hypothetical protein